MSLYKHGKYGNISIHLPEIQCAPNFLFGQHSVFSSLPTLLSGPPISIPLYMHTLSSFPAKQELAHNLELILLKVNRLLYLDGNFLFT